MSDSLHLLPPGGTPSNPSGLTGSRDLIQLFGLDSIYDKHLRPYLPVATTSTSPAAEKPKQKRIDRDYGSLVPDVPGRNTIKKDGHLAGLILNPDFHHPSSAIHAALPKLLSDQTKREAWTLQVGEIPGFDRGIWEGAGVASKESTSKRKNKRKREISDKQALPGTNGGPPVEESGPDRKRQRED